LDLRIKKPTRIASRIGGCINLEDLTSCVVELEKAETTSTSQNSRTTASSPLRYSGPVIRF